MRVTKSEKELFEKRFLEAMKKRDALIKAGRKALKEAREKAKALAKETV
jgi:lactate dehydrogenase-like 2-hydroxyacid dehydrogenase